MELQSKSSWRPNADTDIIELFYHMKWVLSSVWTPLFEFYKYLKGGFPIWKTLEMRLDGWKSLRRILRVMEESSIRKTQSTSISGWEGSKKDEPRAFVLGFNLTLIPKIPFRRRMGKQTSFRPCRNQLLYTFALYLWIIKSPCRSKKFLCLLNGRNLRSCRFFFLRQNKIKKFFKKMSGVHVLVQLSIHFYIFIC